MQVLLADPAAFTPQYDHALATALADAGADVRLVTSPFRFGEAPEPVNYRRAELFYPLSSHLFRRSAWRLPLKAIEHPLGLARLARCSADVVHVQWFAAPQLDDRLLRLRAPAVFTAHDLLPRRTASPRGVWRRLLARFPWIVVHTRRGRDLLVESGAVLRALGAGVPAVVYDVGGLAEPVQTYGAGRVVPAGDVDALTAAVSELLGDPEALA